MTPPQIAGRPPLAVLVAISMLQPFALNVLAPATPGLTRSLGTDYSTVQLTLTLYLLTVALSQLVVGPISDRIGRRPCVLAGVLLFAAGSVIGALADRIEVLLLARVVQAVGGGTCFALARAIVRDSASKDQSASLIGYMSMAMVVSPMIAPLVGGFLDARFGWRSIFWAMLALALVVGASAVMRLRETATRTESGTAGSLATHFPDLLRDRTFLSYTCALSFTSASFFAFVAGAPYVVVEVMGRSPDVYGLYFVLSAGGYMAGNFLAGRFGQRMGSEKMTSIGLQISVVAIALEVLVVVVLPWTPATLFLPLTLNAVGNGLTIPGSTACALSVRPRLAGTAAGLLGAIQLGLGALLSILTGYFVTIWPHALVAAMLVCILCAWASLAAVRLVRD
jgi:DHA1 family bicyclomycin/chloramphenicol resistance-like MFS transporter